MLELLNDKRTYLKITKDITQATQHKNNEIIKQWKTNNTSRTKLQTTNHAQCTTTQSTQTTQTNPTNAPYHKQHTSITL